MSITISTMKYNILLSLILLISCKQNSTIEEYPIMGDLPMGKYLVGFKTLFTYDLAKNPVPYSDWDGNLKEEDASAKGRQYQINIWYPANSNSGSPLKYRDYGPPDGQTNQFWCF